MEMIRHELILNDLYSTSGLCEYLFLYFVKLGYNSQPEWGRLYVSIFRIIICECA